MRIRAHICGRVHQAEPFAYDSHVVHAAKFSIRIEHEPLLGDVEHYSPARPFFIFRPAHGLGSAHLTQLSHRQFGEARPEGIMLAPGQVLSIEFRAIEGRAVSEEATTLSRHDVPENADLPRVHWSSNFLSTSALQV